MPDSGEVVDVLLKVALGLVVMGGFVRWVETVEVPKVVRDVRGVVSRGALVDADGGLKVGAPGLGWVEERGRLLEISEEGTGEEIPAEGVDNGLEWW